MTDSNDKCFSSDLAKEFIESDSDLIEDLEKSYQELIIRRKDFIEFGDPNSITEMQRAFANCAVLQQVALHRSERLMVSSGTMILERNTYGLALIVRGHFETTAVLGYACNRINSFINGNISFDTVIMDIARLLLGAKHEFYKGKVENVNIMKCLEKADQFFEHRHSVEKKGILTDCHGWLSEFCHPNFNSNFSAARAKKELGRIEFSKNGALFNEDKNIFGYLDISSGMFIDFFDQLDALADKAFCAH